MAEGKINPHEYNRKKKFPNLESKVSQQGINLNQGKHDEPKTCWHKNTIFSKDKKVDIFTYNEVMAEAIRERFFYDSELRHFVDSENCYSFTKIDCEYPARLAGWLNRYAIENNSISGISPMSMISVSGGYEMRCSIDGAFVRVVQTDLEKPAGSNPFDLGMD